MSVLGNVDRLVQGGRYAWDVLVPSPSSITKPVYRAYNLMQLVARMRLKNIPGVEQISFSKLMEFKLAVAKAILGKAVLKDLLKPGIIEVEAPKGIDFSDGNITEVIVACKMTSSDCLLKIIYSRGSFRAEV